MKALFIILCIVLYIIIGIITGMIFVYIDKKQDEFNPDNSDANFAYVLVAIFWPLALAAVIIVYPFAKLYDFFMWFGKHIDSNDKQKGEK